MSKGYEQESAPSPGHEHRFERVIEPSGSTIYQCACGVTASGPELHWKLREARKAGDVATLIEGLDDPVEGWFAARFLGDAGATDAVPELLRHLDSPDPEVRAEVVKSLGKLGASDALPQIERAAENDEMPSVRMRAVEAAAELMPPERVRPLLHAALNDPGWGVRFAAAHTLGQIGDRSDLDALRAARRAEAWWRRGVYRKATRAIQRRR